MDGMQRLRRWVADEHAVKVDIHVSGWDMAQFSLLCLEFQEPLDLVVCPSVVSLNGTLFLCSG